MSIRVKESNPETWPPGWTWKLGQCEAPRLTVDDGQTLYQGGPESVFCVEDDERVLALMEGESWTDYESPAAAAPVTSAGLLAECIRTLEEKGKDYRTSGNRPFSNFESAAGLLGVSPLICWGIYFMKHVSAIMKYCRTETVHSEPIRGRIVDAINYLILLDQEIESRCSKRESAP
jgi:hypothetical protein